MLWNNILLLEAKRLLSLRMWIESNMKTRPGGLFLFPSMQNKKKIWIEDTKFKIGIYKPMEEVNIKINHSWKSEAVGSLETSLTCQ